MLSANWRYLVQLKALIYFLIHLLSRCVSFHILIPSTESCAGSCYKLATFLKSTKSLSPFIETLKLHVNFDYLWQSLVQLWINTCFFSIITTGISRNCFEDPSLKITHEILCKSVNGHHWFQWTLCRVCLKLGSFAWWVSRLHEKMISG